MKTIGICCAAVLMVAGVARASEGTETLWSDRPDGDWLEMYPVGNGWMGAMVGAGRTTHLQFNLSRIWSGRPHCYDRPGAVSVLAKMRELVFANKIGEAYQICDENFMGNPKSQAAYQPCGDLYIDFDSAPTGVVRRLDLPSACHVSTVTWNESVSVRQETFAPYPEKDFIFHRLASSKPGASRQPLAIATLAA